MNPSRIAQARKLLVAAAGYVAALLAYGLLPDPWAKYAAAGLAFLASVGIYVTPNVLTPKQIMAQPGYAPAVSHVPMPVTYDPAPNVDWTPGLGSPHISSYINPAYAKDLEHRAEAVKPKRDKNGRFTH
jgi:hypothetical protein